MKKKLKLTNVAQFKNLVGELGKDLSLAQGFVRGTVPSNFKQKCNTISKKLNAMGPPTREGDGWQKVWRDLKFKVRKKISINKAECNATGGGRFKQLQLSPLEESVANLMQFEKNLAPKGLVFGHGRPEDAEIILEYEEVREPETVDLSESVLLIDEASTSNQRRSENHPEDDITISEPSILNARPVASAVRKKNKAQEKSNKEERQLLLQKHDEMKEKVLNEMSRTLTSIKNTLKNKRKIEEEKLKILKRKNEREEQLFQSEMEIKKITLEIKKENLKMLNEASNPVLNSD